MKAVFLLEGPGWGAGTSTSVPLGVHPFVRHLNRGEVVTVDCPPGSVEEREWQKRIDAQMVQYVSGTGPRKTGP